MNVVTPVTPFGLNGLHITFFVGIPTSNGSIPERIEMFLRIEHQDPTSSYVSAMSKTGFQSE